MHSLPLGLRRCISSLETVNVIRKALPNRSDSVLPGMGGTCKGSFASSENLFRPHRRFRGPILVTPANIRFFSARSPHFHRGEANPDDALYNRGQRLCLPNAMPTSIRKSLSLIPLCFLCLAL